MTDHTPPPENPDPLVRPADRIGAPEPAAPEPAAPQPERPAAPQAQGPSQQEQFPASPYAEPPPSSKAPIIAGVVTAVIVLAVLGFLILRNRPEPVTAPPPLRTPLTTLSPSTTDPTTSGGATSAEPGYTPTYVRARCDFSFITSVEHECGWVTVPEDRQNPDNGREVRLHVVRFASKSADPPADPLIYLDGGPGGSTLEALQFTFGPFWEPLLDDRDLIMFDQRGVGLSEPSLDCPEERNWTFSVLDQSLTPEQERTGALEQITLCHDRLVGRGIDLAQYNSVENAADVADIRIALGIEQWNLLGISYGTRLAETVMRDHPEGVRSVVLDSTYTPDVNLIAEGPANLDRALAKLWEGCDLDPGCGGRYPDLEQRFYDLVDRYDETPVRAPVPDFLNSTNWDVLFDGDWLLSTVFQALYSEQAIPLVPQMVEELENGETTILSLLTANTLTNMDFISFGMHLSVQCNEEVAFTTQEEITAGLQGYEDLVPSFDGDSNLGDFMLAACDIWQAGTAAPAANEPVRSDIPTLVLAGEYDPITPPAWGASAAAYLPNSTYIEFTGLGHGTSIAGDCPLSIVFTFLNDPAAAPGQDCVSAMAPIDFKIPGEPLPALALVPFTEDILGTTISGVVPEGWTSVGFGSYVRGDSAVDQTAILQQVAPLVSPEALVNLLTGLYNMSAEPERTSTQESELGTWQLWRGDAEAFSVDFAAIDLGGQAAVIVVISNPGEREQLLGELLIPAVEAFRVL